MSDVGILQVLEAGGRMEDECVDAQKDYCLLRKKNAILVLMVKYLLRIKNLLKIALLRIFYQSIALWKRCSIRLKKKHQLDTLLDEFRILIA